MLQRVLAFMITLALLLAARPPLAKAAATDLDSAMTELFTRYKAKGGIVLVGKGSEIVYQFTWGNARRTPSVPVTGDTQFRIASVSKLVTAIGVMQLVEHGKLALDADISNYLGGTLRNPWYPNTPITLRMVMSHTSSLNPKGDYNRGVKAVSDMLKPSKANAQNYVHFKPGTRYIYSNFNGGLLGSLVEAASGQNVTAYMQQHVFAPLGAEGAYAVASLSDPARAAHAYNSNGTVRDNAARLASKAVKEVCDPQHHYDMTTGSLWISGPDLCRVGMMLCNRGSLNGVHILSRDTVLLMESDQNNLGGITCSSPYGLNVNRIDDLIEGEMIYGHQGVSGAVLANLYYDPAQQLTFVLISNSCDNRMTGHVAFFSREAFTLCRSAFWTASSTLPEDAFVVIDEDDD